MTDALHSAVPAEDVSGAATRHLLTFTPGKLQNMLDKGNLAYVRNYERYFDRITVAYLTGNEPKAVHEGATSFVSLGGAGGSTPLDLVLAPLRLLRLARSIGPTSFYTADMAFSWWTGFLLRLFLGARVVLMPVCIPHEIFRSTGQSYSGLPLWLERLFMTFSFAAANSIVTSKVLPGFIAWLEKDTRTRDKLTVVDVFMEECALQSFMDAVDAAPVPAPEDAPRLVYVGRLHPEKRCFDLIEMMGHLRAADVDALLDVCGDGPALDDMKAQASAAGLDDRIRFRGYVANTDLVPFYKGAELFISTVTGTSLREAGIVGTPVVAYELDWVEGMLEDDVSAFLCPPRDPAALARRVADALGDDRKRRTVGEAFNTLARHYWDPANATPSLVQVFGPDEGRRA